MGRPTFSPLRRAAAIHLEKAVEEDLFDDIYSNPVGHFLGSIICINRTDDAYQIQELELVDGQQRLTTLSLLYAAIYAQLAIY